MTQTNHFPAWLKKIVLTQCDRLIRGKKPQFEPIEARYDLAVEKPSPEAIDMNMDLGERLLERTKAKLIGIVGEDLYYAALNPAQAALMLYGVAPPAPRETAEIMRNVFVKKEKLLEEVDAKLLE